MSFFREDTDKTVGKFENNGGYVLRVLARLDAPSNAQYYVTIEDTNNDYHVGYMASLTQFREIGLLLLAFSKFAEEKIRVSDLNLAELAVVRKGLSKSTVIRYAVRHHLLEEFLKLIRKYTN